LATGEESSKNDALLRSGSRRAKATTLHSDDDTLGRSETSRFRWRKPSAEDDVLFLLVVAGLIVMLAWLALLLLAGEACLVPKKVG
jgi:hypothetical protein